MRASPTVAEAIGSALVEAGTPDLFGLLGSGNFRIAEAAVNRGARFYSSRHENGAVAMADGYARASGRVGFAIVHHGPGLTNAITALTEAAKSATPLMLVTAAVGADDPWSNFAINQEALIEATGARCICLDNAGDARRATLEAVDLARTHRRPVVFVVPVDVQQEQFVEVSRGGDENPRAPTPRAPSLDDVQAIADIVVRSRRPVILAGRGASTEGARAALLALGDRTGSLHATTAGAAALFNGRPYNLGIAGGFSSPATKRIIGRADLVLAFGASLNPWTMNHGHLLSETAHVVHVNDRAEALGRQHPVSLKIHGDAEVTATMLDRELERRRSEPAPFRAEVAEQAENWSWNGHLFSECSADGLIDPRTVTVWLDEHLPTDRTVAIDSGLFMGFPAAYLNAPDPRGFLFAQGFMSVGLGLASGIGGAIARPERLTIVAVGDGGALMSLPEFETAARLRLPMIILIYNDCAYGAEVFDFPSHNHDGLVRFQSTDFADIGRALGMHGVTIRSTGDLTAVDKWLEARDGPLVVDTKVNPAVTSDVWAH